MQLIVVTEKLEKIQAGFLDMCIKPNSKHVWILYLKDHFTKFRMLYTLTGKKASKITHYISLFVHYLEISGILQCDNGENLKELFAVFEETQH